MKRSFNSVLNNHTNFESNVDNLIKYGNEIIFDSKRSHNEKQLLVESLILRSCAYWEKFLDTEIVEIVNLDYSTLLESRGLPSNTSLSKKLIKAILFSNAYLDFHYAEKVVSFFNENSSTNHNPFASIPKANLLKIDFTYKIRNYISHYSDFAKKKLFLELQKRKLCKARFIEPGIFLLKKNGEVFNQLINNFSICSIKMRNNIIKVQR